MCPPALESRLLAQKKSWSGKSRLQGKLAGDTHRRRVSFGDSGDEFPSILGSHSFVPVESRSQKLRVDGGLVRDIHAYFPRCILVGRYIWCNLVDGIVEDGFDAGNFRHNLTTHENIWRRGFRNKVGI